MVSGKMTGGLILGASAVFGGVLWMTISALQSKSQVLGCVATTPGCMEVASGMAYSHVAVGFMSAVISLGLYFLVFHKDVAVNPNQNALLQTREQKVALISQVLTDGERRVLDAISSEDGILQATLTYKTDLTPGRVSQILSDFESKGLVSRRPDGRSFRVYVSV